MLTNKLGRKFSSTKLQLVAGIVLVAVGAGYAGLHYYHTWKDQQSTVKPTHQPLQSNQAVDNGEPTISGNPTHISIPSVGIELSVVPGYYYPKSNTWTLTLDKAQYGTMTAPPNNKSGDTFIYAHYRWGVFYKLPKIAEGAEAIITTDNGHTFTYKFRSSIITTPQDTSIFTYKGKPILVLQTCNGLWYQNRQLFTFDLVKVG